MNFNEDCEKYLIAVSANQSRAIWMMKLMQQGERNDKYISSSTVPAIPLMVAIDNCPFVLYQQFILEEGHETSGRCLPLSMAAFKLGSR